MSFPSNFDRKRQVTSAYLIDLNKVYLIKQRQIAKESLRYVFHNL